MADPVEVTAEMVMQVTAVRSDKAERIAAYAAHRYAGLRQADACNQVGIGQASGRSYERFIAVLCDRLGLPVLPERDPRHWNDNAAAGTRGAHNLHHVRRGVSNPNCPLCQEATR